MEARVSRRGLRKPVMCQNPVQATSLFALPTTLTSEGLSVALAESDPSCHMEMLISLKGGVLARSLILVHDRAAGRMPTVRGSTEGGLSLKQDGGKAVMVRVRDLAVVVLHIVLARTEMS